MPRTKRQKTAQDSGIFIRSDNEDSDASSPRRHKQNSGARSNSRCESEDTVEEPNIPPHNYICFNRPFFDVDGANWREWTEGKTERLERADLVRKLYRPGYDAEEKAGIYKAPPSEHKGHKWVMMWDAWLKVDLLSRKAKYCDPEALGMYIYNSWKGSGMLEIGENMLLEFDRAFRKKGESRLNEMWVVISALGLWFNEDEHISEFIMNDDADTTCELIGLLGCALLTALSAIDRAGELKPDSRFLDLALVIGYYLELSHDLPAYGIEGNCVAWRKEAVALFKKGKLDPDKALFATSLRLEKLENAPNYDTVANESLESVSGDEDKENADPESDDSANKTKTKAKGKSKAAKEDLWRWSEQFNAYKQEHRHALGGQKYDVTKMTRAERAAAAFNGKDPLADCLVKDLKANLIDFV